MANDQVLAAKFNAAKNVFADAWKVGTYDWLKANSMMATMTMALAEQQLDATWLRVRAGQASIEEFDAVLERWKTAHVNALAEFNARSGQ
jgi:hypothetical protein